MKTIKRFLGIEPVPLKMPCNVKGFNGKQATPITHYVELSLRINRRQVLVLILIIGLGDHDIILRYKWFPLALMLMREEVLIPNPLLLIV